MSIYQNDSSHTGLSLQKPISYHSYHDPRTGYPVSPDLTRPKPGNADPNALSSLEAATWLQLPNQPAVLHYNIPTPRRSIYGIDKSAAAAVAAASAKDAHSVVHAAVEAIASNGHNGQERAADTKLYSTAPVALGISVPGQPDYNEHSRLPSSSAINSCATAPGKLLGYDQRSANRFQTHQYSRSEVSVPLGHAWAGPTEQEALLTIEEPETESFARRYGRAPTMPLTPPQGSPCESREHGKSSMPSPAQGVGSVAPSWTGGYAPMPTSMPAQVSASEYYNRLYADMRANGTAPQPLMLPPSTRHEIQHEPQQTPREAAQFQYYAQPETCTAQQNNSAAFHSQTHINGSPNSPYGRNSSLIQKCNSGHNHGGSCSPGSRPRKYACAICYRLFTRPSALQTHIYSHTGERPFVCPVSGCGRPFSVASNLRRHSKIHETR